MGGVDLGGSSGKAEGCVNSPVKPWRAEVSRISMYLEARTVWNCFPVRNLSSMAWLAAVLSLDSPSPLPGEARSLRRNVWGPLDWKLS